jgi:hypothetical protein
MGDDERDAAEQWVDDTLVASAQAGAGRMVGAIALVPFTLRCSSRGVNHNVPPSSRRSPDLPSRSPASRRFPRCAGSPFEKGATNTRSCFLLRCFSRLR